MASEHGRRCVEARSSSARRWCRAMHRCSRKCYPRGGVRGGAKAMAWAGGGLTG
jgi:hypothetical protein